MSLRGLPIVLPLTGNCGYPIHLEVDGVFAVTSYVQCEQIRAVADERIGRRPGAVDEIDMMLIEVIPRRVCGTS
jgi:mRNA-degrading endonuclease toxin of MazEF toxin-antitoxin module